MRKYGDDADDDSVLSREKDCKDGSTLKGLRGGKRSAENMLVRLLYFSRRLYDPLIPKTEREDEG